MAGFAHLAFKSDASLKYSLLVVAALAYPGAAILMYWGAPYYRRLVAPPPQHSLSITHSTSSKPTAMMESAALQKALEDYLPDHIPGFSGPARLAQLTGGQSNPSFRLSTRDHEYVVRCKPAGEILESAHAVDREFRYLDALANTAVPVPRVHHLCEDPAVTGSIFYVMDFTAGTVFRDPALPDLTMEKRGQVYAEMARVLAAIHDVDAVALGLAKSRAGGENPLLRQVRRWDKQYTAAKTDDIPEMAQLSAWLFDNIPGAPRSNQLVHGDFRMDNLIFCPDNLRIISVLDWELSSAGEPLTDLAYQIMQRAFHRDWPIPGLSELKVDELGIPSADDFVDQYLRHSDLKSINNWTFYLALAFFRFASICQGVKHRALQGNASAENAAQVGAMTAPLARLGVEVIRGGV